MRPPKISVVVPVLNGENHIRGCIASILSQDFPDFELIVVDNGSHDSTAGIIAEFRAKDPRVAALFEEERSRGKARRKGEDAARGEIIVMTDADCRAADAGWLRKLVSPILESGCDAAQGSEAAMRANFWSKRIQGKAEEKRRSWKTLEAEDIRGSVDTKNFAIRNPSLRAAGGSSDKYADGNDTELSIRLSQTSCRMAYVSEAAILHDDPDSFLSYAKKQFLRGFWTSKISRDHWNTLRKSGFLERTNQTPASFFRFFPGLFRTLMEKGPDALLFDFAEGAPWRAGIVYEKCYLLFGRRKK